MFLKLVSLPLWQHLSTLRLQTRVYHPFTLSSFALAIIVQLELRSAIGDVEMKSKAAHDIESGMEMGVAGDERLLSDASYRRTWEHRRQTDGTCKLQ